MRNEEIQNDNDDYEYEKDDGEKDGDEDGRKDPEEESEIIRNHQMKKKQITESLTEPSCSKENKNFHESNSFDEYADTEKISSNQSSSDDNGNEVAIDKIKPDELWMMKVSSKEFYLNKVYIFS